MRISPNKIRPSRIIYPNQVVGADLTLATFRSDIYRAPPPFMPNQILFNGTSDSLNLGALSSLTGASQFTIATWIRRNTDVAWPGSNQAWFANNQAAQRIMEFGTNPRSGLGEVRLSIADGSNVLQSAYLPDFTFVGQYPMFIVAWFNNGTIGFNVEGQDITPQNVSGSMPTALRGTVSNAWTMGASNAAAPQNRWNGNLGNLAVWVGWSPTDVTQSRALWNYRDPPDFRTLSKYLIPSPTYYWMLRQGTAVEVTGNAPSQPTGTYSIDTTHPPEIILDRIDGLESRQLVYSGRDPRFFNTYTQHPENNYGHYAATPALEYDGSGSLWCSLNRGTGHTIGGREELVRSDDDGATWPFNERPFPGGPASAAINNGFRIGLVGGQTLHGDATPNLRNAGLVRYPGIGAGGLPRWFWIANHNADTFVVDPADGGVTRRVWVFTHDGDDLWTDWTPFEFYGPGLLDPVINNRLQWTSVGKARTILLPDGSLVFGFYYRWSAAGASYRAGLARSTDNGATFAWVADIGNTPGIDYEETHIILIDGELIAFVRVDQDRTIRRSSVPWQNFAGPWPTPVTVTDGWNNPSVIYRARDGIMLLDNRNAYGTVDDQGGNTPDGSFGAFRVSWDKGRSFTRQVKQSYPHPTARGIQGGFVVRPADEKIVHAYANDHEDGTSTFTDLWISIHDENFLRRMRT